MRKFLYILTLCCFISPNVAYSAAGDDDPDRPRHLPVPEKIAESKISDEEELSTAGCILWGSVFSGAGYYFTSPVAEVAATCTTETLSACGWTLLPYAVATIGGGIIANTMAEGIWGEEYKAGRLYYIFNAGLDLEWDDAIRFRHIGEDGITRILGNAFVRQNFDRFKATLAANFDGDQLHEKEIDAYADSFEFFNGESYHRISRFLHRYGQGLSAEEHYRIMRIRGEMDDPTHTKEDRRSIINLRNILIGDRFDRAERERGRLIEGERRREREREAAERAEAEREERERAEFERTVVIDRLRGARRTWAGDGQLTEVDQSQMTAAGWAGVALSIFGGHDAELASAAYDAAATGISRAVFGDSDKARRVVGSALAAATDDQLRAGVQVVGGATAIVAIRAVQAMFQNGEIEVDMEDGHEGNPLDPHRRVRDLVPQEAGMFPGMPFLENLYTNGVKNTDREWVAHPNDLRLFLVTNWKLLTLERVTYMESSEFIADVAARGGNWKRALKDKYPEDVDLDEEEAEAAPEGGAAGPGGDADRDDAMGGLRRRHPAD